MQGNSTCPCHILNEKMASKKYNHFKENPLFLHKIIFSFLLFINIFCQQKHFWSWHGHLWIYLELWIYLHLWHCVFIWQIRVKNVSTYELTNAFTLDTEAVLCQSSTAISTVKITQFLIVHIITKPITNPILLSTIWDFEIMSK